jgi:hypothetical protein
MNTNFVCCLALVTLVGCAAPWKAQHPEEVVGTCVPSQALSVTAHAEGSSRQSRLEFTTECGAGRDRHKSTRVDKQGIASGSAVWYQNTDTRRTITITERKGRDSSGYSREYSRTNVPAPGTPFGIETRAGFRIRIR